MAVGYATLYGAHERRLRADQGLQQDAGLSPARYRNSSRERGEFGGAPSSVAVLEREPSAELRPTKDTDRPPYQVLDAILEAFIEEDFQWTIVARSIVPSSDACSTWSSAMNTSASRRPASA
jgi:NH3-dependent NAD+ synthetase